MHTQSFYLLLCRYSSIVIHFRSGSIILAILYFTVLFDIENLDLISNCIIYIYTYVHYSHIIIKMNVYNARVFYSFFCDFRYTRIDTIRPTIPEYYRTEIPTVHIIAHKHILYMFMF